MSNRRFVDVSVFRRMRALLLSLPQTDEVMALLADINQALGKGRVKRKAVSRDPHSERSDADDR